MREWIGKVGAGALCIEPGSLWEYGYKESFKGRLGDQQFKAEIFAEIFNDLTKAKVLIERWRRHFNSVRPHTSKGCQPPAAETVVLADMAVTTLRTSGRPAFPPEQRDVSATGGCTFWISS
ncbi:MAG: integrase core domain-containing protein [Pseudomonadota bacterium]